MFVWVIVAYYCVWKCKWCLVYVYVNIHAQSGKLADLNWMEKRSCIEHCNSRGEKKCLFIR